MAMAGVVCPPNDSVNVPPATGGSATASTFNKSRFREPRFPVKVMLREKPSAVPVRVTLTVPAPVSAAFMAVWIDAAVAASDRATVEYVRPLYGNERRKVPLAAAVAKATCCTSLRPAGELPEVSKWKVAPRVRSWAVIIPVNPGMRIACRCSVVMVLWSNFTLTSLTPVSFWSAFRSLRELLITSFCDQMMVSDLPPWLSEYVPLAAFAAKIVRPVTVPEAVFPGVTSVTVAFISGVVGVCLVSVIC